MSNSYPYQVTPEIVNRFQSDGFVETSNVFSASELQTYAAAVDAEVALRTAADTRAVDEKSRYEQSFVQCMRLWETSAEVRPLTCHAGLAGIATQLLGEAGVRLWQDQALYKEAGGAETTAHQDQTFWPLGNAPLVSAWIPFEDVTLAGGAMAYVPGSHKAGRLKIVDITHNSEPYDILNDPELAGRTPQFVEVKAGSVVWHHGFTVHMAAANTLATTRRVFTVVYIGDQARRARDWPVFPLDRDQVGVGELIEGPGMPRLWPAAAELPSPPVLLGEQTGPQYRVPENRQEDKT